MEVKIIARRTKTGATQPQVLAIRFANDHGFVLKREPFGKRGSLIEIHRNGQMIDYRKSYHAALNLMQRLVNG